MMMNVGLYIYQVAAGADLGGAGGSALWYGKNGRKKIDFKVKTFQKATKDNNRNVQQQSLFEGTVLQTFFIL